MKRVVFCVLAVVLLGGLFVVGGAYAEQEVALGEPGLTTVFPEGWTVVYPDTVDQYMQYFPGDTPQVARQTMEVAGVYAAAYSPQGDASIRVIATRDDDKVRQYYDIERYTPAMRTAIKNEYLDKAVWALTGMRYTEAEWTNRSGMGRILNLVYTVRVGDEIVARGKQAYTVRNGWAFTLDIQVQGRRLTTEEDRAFSRMLGATVFPESVDMPLLPVGLTMSGVVPEETYRADVSLRGETTKGATVSAWLLPPEGDDAQHMGDVKANGSGAFRLDFTIPEAGEWRLYIRAELEGYAPSEEARWISYDSRRLPVTFTSLPEGDVFDAQIIISGKTISGVTIQCMEGETNRKVKTGSDGSFSFRLDRTITGERTVVLSFTKKDFNNRRFDITFTRKWEREDYAAYLDGEVQSLSYENLTQNTEKYIGRIVRYEGEVIYVDDADGYVYVQLGMKPDGDGRFTERIIAETDAMEVLLHEGDRAALYIEVTGDFYTFTEPNADGDQIEVDLPSVKLLTYLKR